MTRINSAIPVRNLTDEHLLAEHREIKRLPYCLFKAIKCKSIKKLPEQFTLGTGHVKFFLNKMHFVYWRYCRVLQECELRHFYVTDYSDNFFDVPKEFDNDYYQTRTQKRNFDIAKTHYAKNFGKQEGSLALLQQTHHKERSNRFAI